jgi:hypothetical protein
MTAALVPACRFWHYVDTYIIAGVQAGAHRQLSPHQKQDAWNVVQALVAKSLCVLYMAWHNGELAATEAEAEHMKEWGQKLAAARRSR